MYFKIKVLIHPQSIIHGIVENIDGSSLASMSAPDMKICIAYGLGYPDKIDSSAKFLNLLEQEKLEFVSTFPDELKELYDNLKKRGLEVIAAYRNDNQCGCCGVELTSSEIEQILESKFQQCSYCDGVVI